MPLLIALVLIAAYLIMEKQGGVSAMGGPIDRNIFVATLKPIAVRIEAEYGIKVRNSLAQWAHETGYGSGKIYKNTFNLGSITAESWAIKGLDGKWTAKPGRSIFVNATVEYRKVKNSKGQLIDEAYTIERPFRKYKSNLEGARAWADMLKASTRFPERYAAAKTDSLEHFATVMQKTGYATDPNYAQIMTTKYSRIA